MDYLIGCWVQMIHIWSFRTRFSLSKDPNSGPITRTHQTLFTQKPKIQGIQTPVKERKVYNIEKMVFEYDSSSVKIIKCNIFCNGLLFCLLQKESVSSEFEGFFNQNAFITLGNSIDLPWPILYVSVGGKDENPIKSTSISTVD